MVGERHNTTLGDNLPLFRIQYFEDQRLSIEHLNDLGMKWKNIGFFDILDVEKPENRNILIKTMTVFTFLDN